MIPITELIGFVLHIDKYLSTIIQTYDTWTYAFIFIILFLETGLVLTPFLPGDSLLFASGSFAALGSLNLGIVFTVLTIAAILGDTANYAFGYYLGTIPIVQENFSLVIIGIIIVSVIPIIIEIIRSRKKTEPKKDFTPLSLR